MPTCDTLFPNLPSASSGELCKGRNRHFGEDTPKNVPALAPTYGSKSDWHNLDRGYADWINPNVYWIGPHPKLPFLRYEEAPYKV